MVKESVSRKNKKRGVIHRNSPQSTATNRNRERLPQPGTTRRVGLPPEKKTPKPRQNKSRNLRNFPKSAQSRAGFPLAPPPLKTPSRFDAMKRFFLPCFGLFYFVLVCLTSNKTPPERAKTRRHFAPNTAPSAGVQSHVRTRDCPTRFYARRTDLSRRPVAPELSAKADPKSTLRIQMLPSSFTSMKPHLLKNSKRPSRINRRNIFVAALVTARLTSPSSPLR